MRGDLSTLPRMYLKYTPLLLLLAVTALPLRAVTLDWSTLTWPTPGAVTDSPSTASFDIDPDNPGNDITITLTLNAGATWQSGKPNIVSTLAYGGDDALHIVYETNGLTNVPFVGINIEFHYTYGVEDVMLPLGDIERFNGSNRTEEVRDFVGDAIVGPNLNATITKPVTSTNVAIVDSGLPTAAAFGTGFVSDTNPATADTGNVVASFGGGLTELDFVWGRRSGTGNGSHGVFLYDIMYTPIIPEAEVYWGGALLLAAASFHFCRQRRARGKVAPGVNSPAL